MKDTASQQWRQRQKPSGQVLLAHPASPTGSLHQHTPVPLAVTLSLFYGLDTVDSRLAKLITQMVEISNTFHPWRHRAWHEPAVRPLAS